MQEIINKIVVFLFYKKERKLGEIQIPVTKL